MTEQTKNFLLYGIEAHIKPKEIYKLDGAMLFFIFLLFFLAEASPSPVFSRIFLVLVYLGMVILSFSKTEVTGKKVFWVYGIQSLGFSLLFCWAGTIFMLTTLEEKFYPGYLAALVLLYLLVIALYILLTLALIKKDVYNPSTSKKNGRWLVRDGFRNTWNQCCQNLERPGWLYSHHKVCRSWLLFYFPALYPGGI